MSVNQAILVGRLGAAPEAKTSAHGPWCRLSVATTHRTKDGEDRTTWHTVDVYGRTAENCARYLVAGQEVYIEGRIHNAKVDGDDGVTRYFSGIRAHRVLFLSKPAGRGGEDRKPRHRDDDPLEVPRVELPADPLGDDQEDLPF